MFKDYSNDFIILKFLIYEVYNDLANTLQYLLTKVERCKFSVYLWKTPHLIVTSMVMIVLVAYFQPWTTVKCKQINRMEFTVNIPL